LRRIVLIATAVGMLVAAGVAYAAINTYTAKLTFTTKSVGTAKKPVAIGYTENLSAAGTNGNRTALLEDIKTTISGIKVNTTGMPTCSSATIQAKSNDTSCPKNALLATGYITAVVGSPTNFTPSDPSAFACDPALHAWNSGGGKVTFFFVDTPSHQCGPLQTGSTGPFPGTIKQGGGKVVFDTPIPSFVNRPLGGSLAGSLETEHLVWTKTTKTTKGKTLNVMTSVACSGGKRAFSVSYEAALPAAGSPNETDVVKGTAPCTSPKK
jgi:hypothetical protein